MAVTRTRGRVEAIAKWATSLEVSGIPADVWELCRAQRLSVLAAIAASGRDEAASRVLGAVESWAQDGPSPLPGRRKKVRPEEALYAATALSMALDFDDYVCFGHTGHSAVLTPLVLAAETGALGTEQLTAQVLANEVGARLGGACLLGPLNGQLWSFIHAGASALAASRLLGLDEIGAAHALSISLTNAPRPTVAGFMAPDTKLLTAAEPAVAGLRAARLAASGVTGPLDVLDDRSGFLPAFSHAPLPSMFDGLGAGWATRTISIKPYPGCAYLDTTLDALGDLGPPPASEVESVSVRAGLMTCGMDALSGPYADGVPTPVTVTFSIRWNVAIALLAGRVTPAEVNASWLREHHEELRSLAERVELFHGWDETAATAAAFERLLPPSALARDAGRRRLLRALRRMRSEHPGVGLGWSDLLEVLRIGRSAKAPTMRGSRRSRESASGFWEPGAIEAFAMTFPASVELRLKDGSKLRARAAIPRGGAGCESVGPADAAREKFDAWAPALWGDQRADEIRLAVSTDSDDLVSLL